MTRLEAKRAIVTGAGSGIGRATAIRLAAEGARVACIDLKAAARTVGEVGADHGLALECDVADPSAVAATVAKAVESLEGVDVVCNIAGIGHFAQTHEETHDAFDRVIRVNVHGTFNVCRAVLPLMLEAGAGVIINTASVAGLMGQAWSAAYAASKGAVVMLTKALAYEYADKGIRVNAVAPGGINTPILASFSRFPEGADARKIARAQSPLGLGEPEDVAAAFAYLASDEARYVTGAVLVIDGGVTA